MLVCTWRRLEVLFAWTDQCCIAYCSLGCLPAASHSRNMLVCVICGYLLSWAIFCATIRTWSCVGGEVCWFACFLHCSLSCHINCLFPPPQKDWLMLNICKSNKEGVIHLERTCCLPADKTKAKFCISVPFRLLHFVLLVCVSHPKS